MGTLGRGGSEVETALEGLRADKTRGQGKGCRAAGASTLLGSLAPDPQPSCVRVRARPRGGHAVALQDNLEAVGQHLGQGCGPASQEGAAPVPVPKHSTSQHWTLRHPHT